MGRQVRFRATDADLRMLEEHLRDIGAVFVPWMASSPEVVTQPTMDPPRGWATDPWIVRREDLPCLTRYLVEAQGYWLIDDEPAPSSIGTATDRIPSLGASTSQPNFESTGNGCPPRRNS